MKELSCALFFGDFKGYSKLDWAQSEQFLSTEMRIAGELLHASPTSKVLAKNTWGDGLFVAFACPRTAAQFAIQLQAALAQEPRVQTKLRVALHYGPVTPCVDPVSGQANVSGPHVSHTARLEPSAEPGQVYATEAFMCRMALEPNSPVRFRYLKHLAFAKDYGVYRCYRVLLAPQQRLR